MNISDKSFSDYESRPHVLVVDDDARIRELVTRYLSEQGFVVMTAAQTQEARALLKQFIFDVMVVDVMMPGETGLEFTKDIRGKFSTPVILLTALGESEDRIRGLETGADDYVSKPFEPRELVLRIQSILRRTGARQQNNVPFKIGKWVFDPDLDELQNGQTRLKLTATEVNLLVALAARPREVISREELAQQCGLDAGERTIDVQVTRLRRKIEDDTKAPRYLLTVRGKGYMLRAEQV